MALKIFHLLSLILLIFLDFTSLGHANRNMPTDHKTTSPFDFLNHLKGCHKGNKTKGIHKLKYYLQEFGYLDHNQIQYINNDDFDDALEYALKTYQQNYHINPTGQLDANTISKMTSPRCGVPDIVNGTNSMNPHKTKSSSTTNSTSIHTVSHFTFFPQNQRWPPSKTHLTYGFLPRTPTDTMAPIGRAFQKWASATHFTFSLLRNYQNADLVIGFYRGNHGDGSAFDGRGGTLAHAFAPTNGRCHFDADETWSIGAVPNAFDLETVAVHEIGHLLGLGHSSVEDAIMYPTISSGATKNLHDDDIQGIRALYNVV